MNMDESSLDGTLITGFMVGEAAFGVDAQMVLEVVKVGAITPVHGAPPGVAGIRNLRGRIVTVVDMAVHLGLGEINPSPETRLLIMEDRGESFGFLVDIVTDAFVIRDEGLLSPASSLGPALASRIRGVWRDGDQLTAILDGAALFQWEPLSP